MTTGSETVPHSETGSRGYPVPSKAPDIRTRGSICLALALITVALYAPVAEHGFVNIDDDVYITENTHVQTGLRWENMAWAFRTGYASNWHPLTWVSHMLDCQLFGQRAGGPHLVNVAFHVANTLLFFLVLSGMTGALWRSAMVAALFALHPLHVESVAWLAERKDVLSTFFFMLTLAAYAVYVTRVNKPETAANPRIPITDRAAHRFYLLALFFFALGLMSKPMLVSLPFVLLLLDLWPLRRFQMMAPKLRLSTISPLLVEKVPFLILSVSSSIVTILAQGRGGAVQTGLSFGARFANAVISYERYLGMMLWPKNLAVLYPHPIHWPIKQVLVAGLVLLTISAGTIFLRRSRPYLVVGWFWFLGTLVPVIGFVQVGLQAMADRYSYVPLIGLFIMAVWGITEVVPPFPIRNKLFILFSSLILTGLSWTTARQVRYWHDSETLFQHALSVTRHSYLALNNLGVSRDGEIAVKNYEEALKINPASGDAHNNLGIELAVSGNLDEAIRHFHAAIRFQPGLAGAHSNLGMALAAQHRWAEAVQEYQESLRLKPDDARVHNNLGNALDELGKPDQAATNYKKALQLDPDNAEIHFNFGMTLSKQGNREAAVAQYAEALRLKPDYAQAKIELRRLGPPGESPAP